MDAISTDSLFLCVDLLSITENWLKGATPVNIKTVFSGFFKSHANVALVMWPGTNELPFLDRLFQCNSNREHRIK